MWIKSTRQEGSQQTTYTCPNMITYMYTQTRVTLVYCGQAVGWIKMTLGT